MKPFKNNQCPRGGTFNMLKEAALLYIDGKSWREIAKTLQVCESNLRVARLSYSSLWQSALDEAMAETIKQVRETAGTDAVFEDPNTHLQKATRAMQWLNEKGEKLFPDNGKLTLTRVYEEFYLPNFLFEATINTKNVYSTAVTRWAYLTGNPPIEEITSAMLVKFREALFLVPGKRGLKCSSATVRNRMRTVQCLLDKCGPKGPRNREAFGFLKEVPYARAPRMEYKIPRTITEEQIAACYEAAACMDWPWSEGVKPPAWWKALLVLAWNTGLRTGSILTMRMSEIDWAGHRAILPSRRMKSKRPQVIYLNEVTMDHLVAIRGKGDRELLFPWPSPRNGKSYRHTHDAFFRSFKKLQKIAGIPEDQYFGIHTIRKTLATRLWEQSPAAAQYALGHTGMDVTRQHYVDGGPIVARALDALPQPAAFCQAR